jgi:hypothetical protein
MKSFVRPWRSVLATGSGTNSAGDPPVAALMEVATEFAARISSMHLPMRTLSFRP